MSTNTYILEAKRTPIGGFLGSLSHLSAIELGTTAINAIFEKHSDWKEKVDEVILGNVLSANLGQSPARQAAIFSGIPERADATTINKICASGLKSVAYADLALRTGQANLVVAGGMESMSNAPFYLPNHRSGHKSGNHAIVDGMIKDGLWDPYHNYHMGNAAEVVNRKYDITREEQDQYTLESFRKATEAQQSGLLSNEIIPMSKPDGTTMSMDEDIFKLKAEKVGLLKPIFEENGTITAANASNLNDGAAAILVASKQYCEEYKAEPIARIISHADAAQAPELFTTSPALAIQKALHRSELSITDIDYFEINEAYSNVPIIISRLLNIELDKINIHGGAVAVGHPIGASGARILASLINVLQIKNARYGIAAICNGGGGATAMIIENLKR